MEISGGEPSDSTKAVLAEFDRRRRVSLLSIQSQYKPQYIFHSTNQ